MEAIGLIFSKFSDELISAQITLLSFCLALGVYWMLIRKKKKESAEWVPAALVRAYLDRMRADERETRMRLFGEESAPVASGMPLTQMMGSPTMVSNDPALLKEIEALRAQLGMADTRAMEFDKTMNGVKAEKAALEQKLKDALAAAAAGGGAAAAPANTKELEDLRAKLQEYEVIEDDLANLKKFQKENELLKQRISQLEGGAPAAAAPAPAAPVAAAPAPAAPKAEAPPVTVIQGGKSDAAPAGEANTNVLAPVTPTVDTGAAAPAPAPAAAAAAAAPASDKSPKQKEEELLSEFEKMLAS